MRKSILGVLAVITAITVSGCVEFDGNPSPGQQGIGPVSLTFTICATQDGGPSGSCSAPIAQADTDSYPSQVFVGFEVPLGTGVPASFKSSAIDATSGPSDTGPQIPFTASHWYSTALEEEYPAGPGYEWAGYVSSWQSYSDTGGPQNFTTTIDFGLPPGKNGKPFTGPFDYDAVVGAQQYESGADGPTTPPANTPYCPNSGAFGPDGSDFYWECFGETYPAVVAPATTPTLAAWPINNAAIFPSKEVSASRGSTKKLNFTFYYHGEALGVPFKFSATGTLHGAKISVSPATLTPSATDSPVTVKVKVPARAAKGTYKIKLTAKLASGQSRTATAELKVH